MKTPLDAAFEAMAADPEDEAARRGYYARLLATEVSVPLDDAGMDVVTIDGGAFVLAFDSEHRLADFAAAGVERAVMSGRALVTAAASSGLGIGINLGVANSAWLLPPDTVMWLSDAQVAPTAETVDPGTFLPPDVADSDLLAIDETLAGVVGQATSARFLQSDAGHLIILSGAAPEAEPAISAHIAEACTIRMPHLNLSVMFADDPQVLQVASRVAVVFDLPQPAQVHPVAPGRDPSRPPKLR